MKRFNKNIAITTNRFRKDTLDQKVAEQIQELAKKHNLNVSFNHQRQQYQFTSIPKDGIVLVFVHKQLCAVLSPNGQTNINIELSKPKMETQLRRKLREILNTTDLNDNIKYKLIAGISDISLHQGFLKYFSFWSVTTVNNIKIRETTQLKPTSTDRGGTIRFDFTSMAQGLFSWITHNLKSIGKIIVHPSIEGPANSDDSLILVKSDNRWIILVPSGNPIIFTVDPKHTNTQQSFMNTLIEKLKLKKVNPDEEESSDSEEDSSRDSNEPSCITPVYAHPKLQETIALLGTNATAYKISTYPPRQECTRINELMPVLEIS